MISVFPDFFPLARHKKVYVLDYLDMKDEFNSYSCKVLMYDPVCSEENNTVDECIQLKSLFSNVYKKQVYSEYGDSIEFYYIN
jgi:hypothetical protein